MHLINNLVTLTFLLALTFANAIIPTQPAYPSSIHPTYTGPASKPTSWTFHPSFTHHPRPTSLNTHTFSRPSGTYEVHHHSGTHTFTHPTGTYYHSTTKPTSTASPLYGRTEATADTTAVDDGCGWGCSRGGCFWVCTGDKLETRSETDPGDVYDVLSVRDEAPTLSDEEMAAGVNARDSAVADGTCSWSCFGLTCECFPNAGEKSAAISKTLVGLVLMGAAAAAAGLV